MKLTKTSAYAAAALCHLAQRRDEGPVQARQVADFLGLPLDSTLKILQALARQSLLRSQLGRGGGYFFQREPEDVTLLEVIEAIDGPIRPDVPIDPTRNSLAPTAANLRRVCTAVATHIRDAVHSVTIEDLIEGRQSIDALR